MRGFASSLSLVGRDTQYARHPQSWMWDGVNFTMPDGVAGRAAQITTLELPPDAAPAMPVPPLVTSSVGCVMIGLSEGTPSDRSPWHHEAWKTTTLTMIVVMMGSHDTTLVTVPSFEGVVSLHGPARLAPSVSPPHDAPGSIMDCPGK